MDEDDVKCVDLFHVMQIGARLIDDEGTGYSSPEYERGVIEFTTMILGLDQDAEETIARVLKGMNASRRQDA
jgi:hypothetical protein